MISQATYDRNNRSMRSATTPPPCGGGQSSKSHVYHLDTTISNALKNNIATRISTSFAAVAAAVVVVVVVAVIVGALYVTARSLGKEKFTNAVGKIVCVVAENSDGPSGYRNTRTKPHASHAHTQHIYCERRRTISRRATKRTPTINRFIGAVFLDQRSTSALTIGWCVCESPTRRRHTNDGEMCVSS